MVNDRLKNLIQPEDDDDITTDAEDRAQGVTMPRFSHRTTHKAETPTTAGGSQPVMPKSSPKPSPKLTPNVSPKPAAKVPKPAAPASTTGGPSTPTPSVAAATDASSSQTSQFSPKTGQSSPKTGQKEDSVPSTAEATTTVISIVSMEMPKLHLLSVLGVLIPHMKYTQQETRMESLRWLMWLHQQLPKRVSQSVK